jgi:hypothetical protein
MTLSITGVDTSAWTTDGSYGYWLAVGFGTKVMTGSDIVLCALYYTNSGSTFTCDDRSSSGYSRPTLDTTNNVVSYSSSNTFGSGTASLSATFTRLLNTEDTTDYTISNDGGNINAIFAHGSIISSSIRIHSSSNRGSFSMTIPSLTSSNDSTNHSSHFAFGATFIISLISVLIMC